jgi:uncharacterized protein
MYPFVEQCSHLFSPAKSEFKYLEFFCFHHCFYNGLWKTNALLWVKKISTIEVRDKCNSDKRVVIVRNATMATCERTHIVGSIGHHNDENGIGWLKKIRDHFLCL